MSALALEKAERHVAELERRLEVLLAIVEAAGYRPEEVRIDGRVEWVLVPTDPGALLEAALEAWNAGVDEGEWS